MSGMLLAISAFDGLYVLKKAQRRANQVRATSSFMPIESLMTILGYANPLAWLLFFFHRIKTMLKR